MPILKGNKMYAVIKSGGKQHRVTEGEVITLEKISAEEGSVIEFPEVLAVNKEGKLEVGAPLLEGAKVTAKILDHIKAPKVTIIKMKRRQDYRRKQGHRQNLTKVLIESIKY
jgi:large subunit ribosomal protein L21|tara:strand:+ start:305 stop:640 length:336 start_codon:yes stop_codon:yes gene_type:complete